MLTLSKCSANSKINYLKYATPFEELLLPFIYTFPPLPCLRLLPAWCKYVRSVHLPWWLLNWLAQYSSIFLLKAIENSLIIQYLSIFLVKALINLLIMYTCTVWDREPHHPILGSRSSFICCVSAFAFLLPSCFYHGTYSNNYKC